MKYRDFLRAQKRYEVLGVAIEFWQQFEDTAGLQWKGLYTKSNDAACEICEAEDQIRKIIESEIMRLREERKNLEV